MQERENPTESQIEDMIEEDQIEASIEAARESQIEDDMIEQQIEDDLIEDQIHQEKVLEQEVAEEVAGDVANLITEQGQREADKALAEKLKAFEERNKEPEKKEDPLAGYGMEATGSHEDPPAEPEPITASMDASATPEEIKAAEEAAKQKARLAREHGLGAGAPDQRRVNEVNKIQAFIDDVFGVVTKHSPSNLIAIAVLELVKDEYIRLSKQAPPQPQQMVQPIPGAGAPGSIVRPGGPVPGPQPPRQPRRPRSNPK